MSAYAICKTCGKMCDQLTRAQDGITYWGHAVELIGQADHEAVPVEYDESILIAVCDFCHDDVPLEDRHFLPVANYTILVEIGDGRQTQLGNVGGFNCCITCAELVAADDWEGLMARYTSKHAGINEGLLSLLWMAVRKHIEGPVRAWLPGDELSGDD